MEAMGAVPMGSPFTVAMSTDPNSPFQTPPLGIVPNFVNPDTIAPVMTITAFSMLSVTIVVLGSRWYTRAIVLKTVGIDDYLVTAAAIMCTVSTAASQVQTEYGLGRHMWDIPVRNASMYSKLFTVATAAYVLSMGLVKLSLLFLYRRILTATTTTVRVTWWASFILVTFNTIPFVGMIIFSCIPIDAAWDIAKIQTARCIDLSTLFVIQGSINVFTDFLILVLPVPSVWRLALEKKKKVTLSILFAVGSFTFIASIARVAKLAELRVQPMETVDYSRGTLNATLWSKHVGGLVATTRSKMGTGAAHDRPYVNVSVSAIRKAQVAGKRSRQMQSLVVRSESNESVWTEEEFDTKVNALLELAQEPELNVHRWDGTRNS